jgi:hypothetical protein
MRGGLFFGDGLGRRLVPLGGTGMEADRLLKVGLEVGEGLSGPKAELTRLAETGMRDLELGLPGEPLLGVACCKGAGTAV